MLLGRSSPTLARVDVPMASVGAEGARLLQRIVRESPTAVLTAQVAPTLNPGWSTAPPA
jgi:hypothetical protein